MHNIMYYLLSISGTENMVQVWQLADQIFGVGVGWYNIFCKHVYGYYDTLVLYKYTIAIEQ